MRFSNRRLRSFTFLIACLSLSAAISAQDAGTLTAETFEGRITDSAQNTGFLVGMAKVDITPDIRAIKVPLNGYADRWRKAATGVLDPLYVRALVVSDPNGRLA